ncbi:MAG TPA: RNA polymerase subunit sigma-70 [Flavobacteriales bacterium]|nr:RNA polymerase subunit sigma-70 [Flavobacteriales bacterium]|tara:strand:+ start:3394 stop:3951 length:558 start_codon:yes stop_codon:yes gene_type:complete
MEEGDINLIEACKRSKPSAQREMYVRFSPMMFAVALRYTSGRADAEDILQEAWIKVFRHLESFSEHNSFEGWLRRIVVNTAITHYRRNQKHAFQLDVDEVHATPADLEAFKELDFTREELATAIAELPKGYGMVFNMYVIEGYKHKEIAERLGIDLNTSKSQLSRARKYLQAILTNMSSRAEKSK